MDRIVSIRFEEREYYYYESIAKHHDIKISDLIRDTLRTVFYPDGTNDDEWYGHA